MPHSSPSRCFRLGLTCFTVVLAVASHAAAEPSSQAKRATSAKLDLGRMWQVHETENFRAHFSHRAPAYYVQRVTAELESARAALREKWLDTDDDLTWNPRCEVVLHETMRSYVAHAGPGSEQTRGSTLIRLGATGVAERRMDLFADPKKRLPETLAHELTHVVLAERFHRRQLPRWADEGIAIVADSPAKQALYRKDARQLRRGETLNELLSRDGYPAPDRIGAFYGRSLAFVNYLLEIGSPSQVVEFVECAMDKGYDKAVDEVYGMGSVAELESMYAKAAAAASARSHSAVAVSLATDRRSQTN